MASGTWLERRVITYAHRGGAKEAPASTRFAFERAISLGATGIELDVHQSADGIVIVSHDPTVDATTDRAGAISELTLAELRALDHAHWFVEGEGEVRGAPGGYRFHGRAPDDPRYGVATFDEVLETTRGTFVNIDIKAGGVGTGDYVTEVAEAIRRHGVEDDVIVTSFDDARTARFAAVAPDVGTSPGVGGLAMFSQAVRSGDAPPPFPPHHVALQVPYRVGGAVLVDERFIEAAHRCGLAVHVWTIDDRADMADLIDLGVDGIMSDVPTVLVGVVTEKGANYLR